MHATVINQYPRHDSTATRLSALLGDFALLERAQFRALVAFASESGLRAVEPNLRRFLDRGHSVYWIVGVDLGGTGRQALEFLWTLKREFAGRVDVRVFSTGDNQTIFHPKVYWLDADDRKVVIVGSANATVGGLQRNFEASLQLDLQPLVDERVLEELDFLWMSYTSPLPPLAPGNLLEVNRALISRMGRDEPPSDGDPRREHPLRGMIPRPPRPAPTRLPRRAPQRGQAVGPPRELIMDILQETRATQVQLPAEVRSVFFKGRRAVHLTQVHRGRDVKTDLRPLIDLENDTHRIEIDAIRGLPRPQIIRFSRPRRSAAAVRYEIVLNGTREYRDLDQQLEARGRRTRKGARRWLLT